jgi:hypothetical protein
MKARKGVNGGPKKILSVTIAVLVSTLAIGVFEAQTKDYYVATSGSNNNDGSIDSPWKTIMHAVRNSGGGDTVMVRAGTYTEEIWIQGSLGHGGSDGKYWTLTNYPGDQPIISGSGARVLIDSAKYVRFRGFHMKGAIVNVVGWAGIVPHHVEILDNLVTGAYHVYAGAVNVLGRNCLVENNILNLTNTGSSNDHGIYILAGDTFLTDTITVRNNYVSGFSGYGIHLYDERKTNNDPLRTISNVVIENNVVVNSQLRAGIIVAAGMLCQIQGVIIRNNIVTANATYGIGAYYEGAGIDDIRIYNNTLYSNRDAGIAIGSGITNVDIKNNIILNSSGSSAYHIDNFDGNPDVNAANNLYWPTPLSLRNITDSHPVTNDPLFIDVGNDDFHLEDNSPAIDAGVALAEVTLDKDGNSRPVDGDSDGVKTYDIGAYEYTGTPATEPLAPPTALRIVE